MSRRLHHLKAEKEDATSRQLTVALGVVANEEGRIEVRKVEDLDRELLERRDAQVGREAVELVGFFDDGTSTIDSRLSFSGVL